MKPHQTTSARRKLAAVIAVYLAAAFSIMISSGGSTMLPVAAKGIGGADIYTLALTLPGVIGIALMPLFGFLSAKNPGLTRPLFVVGLLLASVGVFIRGIAPFFLISALFMFCGPRLTKTEARSIAATNAKFDSPDAVTKIGFFIGLILFLSLSKYGPFGSRPSCLLLAVTVMSLIILIFIIRKKGKSAFIPAPVLMDKNSFCLTAVNFFKIFSSMAVSIFLSVYVMYVMKLPASTSGVVMACYAVAGLFMGPIVAMDGSLEKAYPVIPILSAIAAFIGMIAGILLKKIEAAVESSAVS